MQQIVASGLAAQTCQFDRPCTNLAWCSFPGRTTEPKNSPKQSPTRIYKTAAKEIMTKIPGQHTWLAIKPQLNPCKGKHGKTVKTGAAAAIRIAVVYHSGSSIAAAKPIYHSDRETASEAATATPPFLPLRYVSQRPIRSQRQSQRLQELFPQKHHYLL